MSNLNNMLKDEKIQISLKKAYLNYRVKILERANQLSHNRKIAKAVLQEHVKEFVDAAIKNIEREEGENMSLQEKKKCKAMLENFILSVEKSCK